MIIKINLKNDLKIGDIIPVEDLARKFERDLLPLAILQKIDDDGFELTIEDFENLSFDNSGRYFENKESSLKQINKAIEDILMGKDISPVIIDIKGNVVDGQHRMCAFKILGIKDIPILKSLKNETIFDNFMTRSKKLGIPLLEDFYTEFNLLENKTYQFYKSCSNSFPEISSVLTNDYIENIIKKEKWSDHGSDLYKFYDYELSSLLKYNKFQDFDDIKNSDIFKNDLTEWLFKRYYYVLNDLIDEIDQFPLKISRSINISDSDLDDLISSKNPENKNYGKFWSTGYSDSYFSDIKNTNSVTIEAETSFNDINWIETLYSRFDYDHGDDEKEIQLKEGAIPKIKLICHDSNVIFKEKNIPIIKNIKKLKF